MYSYANAYIAGSLLRPADVRPIPFSVGDDQAIAMLIRYIGPAISATLEVAADGNLEFETGALGAEVDDVSIGGVLDAGATLDVSDAANNTWGECLDLINLAPNWEAVLVDVTRDMIATDACLAATVPAKTAMGAQIIIDTATAVWYGGQLIAPHAFRTDIRTYEKQGAVDPAFPFIGHRAAVLRASTLSTFASGVNSLQIWHENPNIGPSIQLHYELTAATTVMGHFDFTNGPITSGQGMRMVIVQDNDSVMAATALLGQGIFYRSLS